jgi:ubiquinone/menaquinone biosynthesis C-methylase UbiE
MMNETIYDKHVTFYVDFVDRALASQDSLLNLCLTRIKEILGDRLPGARVVDIACGEGYLSRFLGRLGTQKVIGVDLSAALVEIAAQRSKAANTSFRVDDAQRLRTFSDASLDVAVSQMAIMDIPDHRALFRSVRRVLTSSGIFVFSLLHPCFETPFQLPEQSQFLVDANNTPIACIVHRYAREGYWQSGGTGVRGHMGAYHRTLSTLLNDLLAAGFLLERLEEPVLGDNGVAAEVPRALLVAARST